MIETLYLGIPIRQNEVVSYLAGPYSHDDPVVVLKRIETFYKCDAQLSENQYNTISPMFKHATLPFGKLGSDWRFWKRHGKALMNRADEVIVLMIPGWQESTGVMDEIAYMKAAGKPVWYAEVGDDGYIKSMQNFDPFQRPISKL